MANPKAKPARNSAQQAANDARNEEFATLLREGAKGREERTLASEALERAAAAAESQTLIALSHQPNSGAASAPLSRKSRPKLQ